MTTEIQIEKFNIQRIMGHLGQDYFHDYGSTRAERYYYSENIENNDENIFRQEGGTYSDNNKTTLETEIEKALDILNIHPDTIFERETPQYNTLSKYHTARQYHSAPQYRTAPQYYTLPQYYTIPQYYTLPQYYTAPNYYSNRQLSNPLPLPQKLSDPVSSPSEPNKIGGGPKVKLAFKGKLLKRFQEEKEKEKRIKKQNLIANDEKIARRLQEEYARNPEALIGPRRTYRDAGPPALPTNSDDKCINWDSDYDHYFEKNPKANVENERRKDVFTTSLNSHPELPHYDAFLFEIESMGVFLNVKISLIL